MKKIVLFMMMLLCSLSMNAQWSVTPEVGVIGFQKINYKDDWTFAPKLGLGIEYQFSPLFSLQSGGYYMQRGYWFDGSPIMSENKEYVEIISGDLNRHYLQIPLLAKFSWNVGDDVRLSLGAGPYMAFCIAKDVENNLTRYEVTDNNGYNYAGTSLSPKKNQFDHLRSFDWGLTASAGLEVKQWVVNFSYDLSLGKEYKRDLVNPNYHTFSLSVGYKFKFGR